MALYQPTFVVPDVRTGLGQGTVDVTYGLTVSWHINGPSALTKFRIRIYTNDAASTLLLTENSAYGCPAYGTSSDGEVQFFSHFIPASVLASNGIYNGREYKLVITQWWSESSYVRQSSASAFLTRNAPVLSFASPGTIGTRSYTFNGYYSQAQGDVLNWFRWQLALADGTTIYDTGNISGTMDISMTYDGLFSGTAYKILLTAQTENGVEASTGWVPFNVDYDTPFSGGYVSASCAKGTDAVYVEWPGVSDIPARVLENADYYLENGKCYLGQSGGSGILRWEEVNGGPMSFPTPWTLIYQTVFTGTPLDEGYQSIAGLSVGGYSQIHFIRTEPPGGSIPDVFEVGYKSTETGSLWGMFGTDEIHPMDIVSMVLTSEGDLWVSKASKEGGLTPAVGLTPSSGLHPDGGVYTNRKVFTVSKSDYMAYPIKLIYTFGPQICDFIQILSGIASDDIISAVMNGTYTESMGGMAYFNATFENGLNAGNLNLNGDTLNGYSVYRREGDAGVLDHIADVGSTVTAIYDYGAVNGKEYLWYLFPIGETTYISQGLISNWLTPCRWNWTLMECEETENKNIFQVVASYRFRYNVSSGAISNNNAPNLLMNFTRYPSIQKAPQNYKSGSLTGLIGSVTIENGQPKYSDTIDVRDAIYALSTTDNALFLKNRKGDLIRVAVSEAITMQTGDNTFEQTQTMALQWAEIGSSEGVGLYATSSASKNTMDASSGGAGTQKRGQIKVVSPTRGSQVIVPDPGYGYLEQVVIEGIDIQAVANDTGLTAVIGGSGS